MITSMLVCEQHYDGAKHNRKIAVELEKFHQANGFRLIIHSIIILIEFPVLSVNIIWTTNMGWVGVE